MTTFTLSLSPEYVLAWKLWEAVRELIQNSIDQSECGPESSQVFHYNKCDETLTIGTTHCRLDPRTLLLGVSTKRDDENMIGQFGEGYKLAMLVLTRSQYEVVVYNNDTIWRPKFEYSEKYGEHVLVVHVEPNPKPCNGVMFCILGVSQADYESLHEKYLVDAKPDTIYDEDYMRGRIFVGGLYVCEIDDLEYGYNFRPGRLRLDRDRGMASSWDVKYETSRLWEKQCVDEKLYSLLERGSADVASVSHVHLKPTQNAYLAERFVTAHPGVVPVSTQEEADRLGGHKVHIVPVPFRNLLRSMHKFVFHREGQPSECVEAFSRQFKRQLDSEGRRTLDAMLEASRHWRGPVPTTTEDEPAVLIEGCA